MACLILSSKLPNDNSPPCTCNIGILFNKAAMAEDNASVRSPTITTKSGFSNPKIRKWREEQLNGNYGTYCQRECHMKNTCPSRLNNLKEFMGPYDEKLRILEYDENLRVNK